MTASDDQSPPPARTVDEAMEQLDTHGVPRRQFVKLLAGTLVVGGAGSFLAACGGQPTASAGTTGASTVANADGQLALLNWTSVGDYAVQWGHAFQSAATQLGFKSVVLDGKFDASVQQNQFNQLLTQKTTGILIGANDAGLIPTLARGSNQSRLLFNSAWEAPAWYTPWDSQGDFYNSFLIPNELSNVAAATDVLAKALNEEGTVARVCGYSTHDSTEAQRRQGAVRALKKYPKIKYVGELQSGYDPTKSQTIAANFIAKYPDLTGIIAVNDDVATGVVAAIKAAGKVPGKDILVTGANGSTAGIQRVSEGTQLVTTGNVPAYPSFVTVAQFYDRLHGWKPEQAERQYGWRSVIVTKDNVAPYKARYVDGPIGKSFDVNLLSRVKSPNNWDTQFDAYPISDLASLWPETPQPKNYKAPAAYLAAQKNGDFERIAELYKQHYKTPVLSPSPAA